VGRKEMLEEGRMMRVENNSREVTSLNEKPLQYHTAMQVYKQVSALIRLLVATFLALMIIYL
jgi:hypothetical protein